MGTRRTREERERIIEAVVEQMREQLECELRDNVLENATLDQIEKAAGRAGRELSKRLQERLVEERTQEARPNQVDCRCGARARYKDRPARTVVTAHGLLTYRRPSYYCPGCRASFSPLDASLGVVTGVTGSTTEQVRVWSSWLSGQLPFAQAATTLQMLTSVSLSAATMERIAVAVGAALRAEQARQVEEHGRGDLPEPSMAGRGKHRPDRLYIGMDGLFVPLRDAWKKDGTQGDLACRFGECKVGVVYEAYKGADGRDTRVRQSAYTATMRSVEEFGPLLGALAHQHGHHFAREVVVIGDGAPWIWQIAATQFGNAVQIVDFFHACQHLAEVADARFGQETAASKEWQRARQEELKNNRLSSVLSEIKAWRPSNAQKQNIRRSTYNYFANNERRMRYKTFLERGYHIGSGVVEASCKHVIAQRMDQAGMHWRVETADAIAALRAAQCATTPIDLRAYCKLAA